MKFSANSQIKQIPRFLLVVALAFAIASCGKPAPVAVSFRSSLLDSGGMVMVLESKGNGYLACRMNVWNYVADQSRTYLSSVGAGARQSIGLIEANWSFQTGEEVEVEVEGYKTRSLKVP